MILTAQQTNHSYDKSSRLRTLIKKYGSLNAVPKKMKSAVIDGDVADAARREKVVANTESLAALIEALRVSSKNDYKIVAEILQDELTRGVKKSKGFGAQ